MKKKTKEICNKEDITIIEITKRICSDKVQPKIHVGNRYIVISEGKLKDGTRVLNVQDPVKFDNKDMRINAARFQWKRITAMDLVNEQKEKEFKNNIETAIDVLNTHFSEREQKNMLLVPSAILEIAKHYAKETIQICRADKKKGIDGLDEFKKLGRELTSILNIMDKDAQNALNSNYQQLVNDTESFIEKEYMKFFCFKNVLNMEYKRVSKNDDNRTIDVRTSALCALYFLEMFVEHEAEVDKMIGEKIGKQPQHEISGDVKSLHKILAKYALFNTLHLSENQNMKTGFYAIKNALRNMSFNIHEIEV